MDSAAILEDLQMTAWGRPSAAMRQEVKRPAPAGWRIDPFETPHFRNQIHRWLLRGQFDLDSTAVLEIKSHAAEADALEQGRITEELRREFDQHATQWKNEITVKSSITDIVLHPSYQRIIGMGYRVLPFIIEDLNESANFWFHALNAITGVNPVHPEDKGRVPRMRSAWLNWAKAHAIL